MEGSTLLVTHWKTRTLSDKILNGVRFRSTFAVTIVHIKVGKDSRRGSDEKMSGCEREPAGWRGRGRRGEAVLGTSPDPGRQLPTTHPAWWMWMPLLVGLAGAD